ncbi:MAG: lysylphosphatidylglycerol synthase domain-containing protein [Acidimicrobiales bacterium]
MNAASKATSWVSGRGARLAALLVTSVAVAVIARAVDFDLLASAVSEAGRRPGPVALAVGAFGLAFVVRAIAWRRVLPRLRFGHALAAIHLALGANHVLPFRLGEPFRVLSVTRRAGIPIEAATASALTLRAADLLAVVVVGVVVAPAAFVGLVGPAGWLLLGLIAVVAGYGWRWLSSLAARRDDVRLPGPTTFGLAAVAWLAESVLVREGANLAGLDITWSQAALVTTVAVAAQVAAVAPGGFGTYEAAAVAAYVALGYDAEWALVAALAAHAIKTAYSLAAGAVALIVPGPAFIGRLRLASTPDRYGRPGQPDRVHRDRGNDSDRDDGRRQGPVLLFMPAYDEEGSVAACVGRAPSEVLGRPVDVLVIDDGSTDRTVERARRAGAEVLSLDHNRGLGAAVRVGLAEGVRRGAAAVAFCDADGEYPPEELANLVGPILAGDADYVAGSRFMGRIDHMRPNRRLGNLVLSALLSIIARRRISDGQTGYRAFSPRAAADAEVIHDFNSAQVLTLDLLAKGHRYREVPISYHYRTEGESFIRLGRYVRNVIPAVYRELNPSLIQPDLGKDR